MGYESPETFDWDLARCNYLSRQTAGGTGNSIPFPYFPNFSGMGLVR